MVVPQKTENIYNKISKINYFIFDDNGEVTENNYPFFFNMRIGKEKKKLIRNIANY